MNAVTTTAFEQTVSFAHDLALHLFGLHREHRLAIDDSGVLVGKTRVRGASDNTMLSLSFEKSTDNLRCRLITLNSGIRRRA